MKHCRLPAIFLPLLALLAMTTLPARARVDLQLSDTNILQSGRSAAGGARYTYDYNRLRLKGNAYSDRLDLTLILDNETLAGRAYLNSPDYRAARDPDLLLRPYHSLADKKSLLDRLYIYRLHADIHLQDDLLSFGLLRAPYSIGRVWTPTDVFNPVNPLAIEKEERLGVTGIQYLHYFGEFGRLQANSAFLQNGDLDKAGFRFKSLYAGVDAGLCGIAGDDFTMLGFELEGNAGETGMELRAEGGWFHIDATERDYFRGIAGLEYGFADGPVLTLEYLFNGPGFTNENEYGLYAADGTGAGSLARHYAALLLARELSPLVTGSLAAICNLTDNSRFIAPSLSLSLTDNSDAALGCQIFNGSAGSEYGRLPNLFYARLNWYF